MNAIMVSVNYTDILKITLPYNRHHFDRMLIVTSLEDYKNVLEVAEPLKVDVFGTNAFYDDGAAFNKWKALEQGLDVLQRKGWLCLMDADVLWPRDITTVEKDASLQWNKPMGDSIHTHYQYIGHLLTPLRRMYPGLPSHTIPTESTWRQYPIHRNINEWAGYSQVFHASDNSLHLCANCNLPREDHADRDINIITCRTRGLNFSWHETNWRHAGGADSFFQQRWQPRSKIRPPWEVLHLGEAGVNWCGRTSKMLDGSFPPNHQQNAQELQHLHHSRRTHPRGDYQNPTEKLF